MSNWTYFLLFFLVGTSRASADYQLKEDLNPIIVKDQREDTNGLIDAPVKVEVLSAEYLKEQQYQDISEALQDVPGVTFNETERMVGSKTALIQGFGENSVLVMIDGVPISQNSSFGFDLSQMATSNIQRVEVIKGGASALYGSQAMGGVINIITKKNTGGQKVEGEYSQGLLSSGDSGKAENARVFLQSSYKNVGFKITASQRKQEGFDKNINTISQDGDEFLKRQASARIDYQLKKASLFFDGLYFNNKNTSSGSRPYSSNAFGPSLNITDTESFNLKLGAEGNVGTGKIRAILNWERNEDNLVLNDNPTTPFKEIQKSTSVIGRRFDLQVRDLVFGSHKITVGTLAKDAKINQGTISQAVPEFFVETADIQNKRISSYEAFVQDNFWIKDFEFSPGARYQYDRDFGSYVAPKINISHFMDIGDFGLKSWASVGTGYRAPSVKERFFTLDHTSVANYIVEGNPNLAPESSLSFQLGEEIKTPILGRELQLYGNLFLNRINNLIEIAEGEPRGGSSLYTYQNFKSVISRGFELGLKTPVTEKISLNLSGSYTETIDEQTNLLVANRPLVSGMSSLTHQTTDDLQFILLGRLRGSQFSDAQNQIISKGFFRTDIKANYRVNKNLKFFGSLNNIFDISRPISQDEVISTIDLRPVRGREFFFGVNMEVL